MRRTICLCIFLVLTSLGAHVTTSRVEEPNGVLQPGATSCKVAHAEQTYQIDVLPVLSPVHPLELGHKLPVLFVLDGNLLFPAVSSMASMLSLEQMPSVLVVGIGYPLDPTLAPGPFLLQYQARRNHDYTPTPDSAFLRQMQATYARYGTSYPARGTPGGAAAFLAFIDNELKPFIAAHYPQADPHDATIMGDSLGGLFAMHVLLTSPDSFERCASPGTGAVVGPALSRVLRSTLPEPGRGFSFPWGRWNRSPRWQGRSRKWMRD